jgi:hypothetical protein
MFFCRSSVYAGVGEPDNSGNDQNRNDDSKHKSFHHSFPKTQVKNDDRMND